MIVIDGNEYRTLEEQVVWLSEHHQDKIAEYLKSAEVEDNTLYITDQDGNVIEFQGGGATAGVASIGGLTGVVNLASGLKVYSAVPGANAIMVKIVSGGGLMFGEDAGMQVDLNTIQSKLTAVAPMYITNNTIMLDAAAVVDGTNDGTNWTKIKINGVEKNIPTGGSGQTYTAGDGLTLADHQFEAKIGDGVEIDNNGAIAAKVSNAGYVGFDGNNAITLNNAAKNAIEAVATKSTVSGTNDGTNWSTITIDGTTKNIPQGGTTYTAGDGIVINGNSIAVDLLGDGGLMFGGDDNQLCVDNTQIPTISAMNTAISAHHDSTKQDTLAAGGGIQIANNTIGARVGDGLVISNGNIEVFNGTGIKTGDMGETEVDTTVIATVSALNSGLATKSTVSGTNDGTNWSTITIDGTTKAIPSGGGGGTYTAGDHIDITNNVISAVYQIEFLSEGDV